MGDEKTGPVQRPPLETDGLARDVGYLEAKFEGLKEIIELRMDQFSDDIKSLPCRGKADCPISPPKKSGSAEYPKVPKPEPEPGATSVSVDQVIDWMERLSKARVSQFRRWALLIGGLAVAVVGSSTWTKCNMEERISALAAKPRVQQVTLPPGPPTITFVGKPDAER